MANLIDLVLKGKTSDASAGVDKLSKSMKSLSSSVLLSVNNFMKLVSFLTKLTDATDEYTTSLRLLKTTLGDAEGEATKFIGKLSEMTGINTATLNKQTAKFVQLGESLSFSNDQAEKFSENLSILSTKLSLLYNTDYETMANALQKAVQGSQVTLKSKTGISINDMSLQATLNANAIDRQVSSLNDAEKALVRYATVLRQVTSDTSVYENAVNSLAWQKRMLSYQLKELASGVGQLVTPALTQLYIIINGVIMAAIELVKILAKIFNININWSTNVSNVSNSYDKLGSSITGASNAARKSLRGFDKLNNITTPAAGGGGGGGGFGIDNSLLKLLDDVDDKFLEIKNKASEIKDQILKWLGIKDDLSNAEEVVHNIWTWIKSIGGVLAGYTIAKWLGLGTSKKIGLALTIGSIPFYVDGIKGVQNGELTPQKFLEIFGGAAGLGVGAGMLTGNWKIGLTVTLATAAWGGSVSAGEWMTRNLPDSVDWYIDRLNIDYDHDTLWNNIWKSVVYILGMIGDTIKLGVQKVFGQELGTEILWGIVNSIPILSIIDNIADIFINGMNSHLLKPVLKGIEEWKPLIWQALKNLIIEITKMIEKIPYIGKGIATSIRTAFSNEEKNITTTLENTTTSSINTAKQKINTEANKSGEETGTSWNTGLKRTIDNDRTNLTKTIETTISTSSKNSENVANQSGSLLANKEMSTMSTTITNTETGLRRTITKTVTTASNNTDTSSAANIGQGISRNITGGIDRSNLGSEMNTRGKTIGSEFGDSISSNMRVNGSTLGTTLNSALSSVISKIKSNNWNIFGSGGPLANLLNFRWSYFADGGFPTQGEMFIAREAGAEMVGSINGHTAVANNDQIVKGIQSGVFTAMMSALSNTDFGGDVVIEAKGDADGLLNFIEFKQKQKDRQFN